MTWKCCHPYQIIHQLCPITSTSSLIDCQIITCIQHITDETVMQASSYKIIILASPIVSIQHSSVPVITQWHTSHHSFKLSLLSKFIPDEDDLSKLSAWNANINNYATNIKIKSALAQPAIPANTTSGHLTLPQGRRYRIVLIKLNQ